MRFVVLSVSVLIQIALGGVYAWSAFWPALRETHGLSASQTQVIFGVSVTSFTANMMLAGWLFRRWGPRWTSLLGGVLFASGYLVASASGGAFSGLFCGLALLTGGGVAFAYVSPIAACIQWFPSRKGLATGLIVAGFAAGAILLNHVTAAVLGRGVAIVDLFRWIGLGFGGVVAFSSLFLTVPGAKTAPAVSRAAGGEAGPERFDFLALLSRRDYWVLTVGVFCGTFAGSQVIGNLKPIGLSSGSTVAAATLAITALAVGNASGRFVWGAIVDRLGRRAIPISLCVISGAVGLLAPASGMSAAFVVAAACAGFGYGSCFVVYAHQTAARFGPERVASHYPAVFLSYGISGSLGPILGGWLFDRTGSHMSGILIAAGMAAAGALVCSLVDAAPRTEARSQSEPEDTSPDSSIAA